ncbi:hypothetical protein LTR08_006756 [Meristemomyces frigidus]|nr:hypothetical protein LTR08_006756 [Meristemomyces frigidus]
MVSFSCEGCGDVLTKKKLDSHKNQCRGATFTCLDCMVWFQGTEYRAHTSCISEAQKYQGHLYKDKKGKGDNRRKSMPGGFPDDSQAMVPRNAYVEDAPDGDESMNAIAVVDVPPRAPTPPPAHEALHENVNVFDFLVSEETPIGNSRRELEAQAGAAKMVEDGRYNGNGDSRYSQYSNGNGSQYLHQGFSYGNAPVEPTMERYDSWHNMNDAQQPQQQGLMPPPTYITVTPGPTRERKEKHKSEKSDKKRKRQHIEELDLSSSAKRPSSRGDMSVGPGGRLLHSGLTGGLSKLVTDPEFFGDRIDAGPTPISPIKRTKRSSADKEAKDERRKSSYTSYTTTTVAPMSTTSKNSAANSKHQRIQSRDTESTHSTSKPRHRKRRDSSSSPDDSSRHRSTVRKEYRAIEYPADRRDRPASVQPSTTNQVSLDYSSRAEMFLSFVNKGPESERGTSINKALKRYHRERDVRGEEKEEEAKELWKALRMRRNSRGEIVVFL